MPPITPNTVAKTDKTGRCNGANSLKIKITMQRKVKKYNDQTGGYKIDIFDNGGYLCSTSQSKTCKEAVEKYKKSHPHHVTPKNKIFGRFDYKIVSR